MSELIAKELFFGISTAFFTTALVFYVITCFQWFSYRIERVIFHFARPAWHVFFFIVPIVLFYTTGVWFFIYFYFGLIPSLMLWHKKLDKKLVFTDRIKRFFAIFALAILIQNLIFFILYKTYAKDVIMPIVVSLALSHLFEKFIALRYKNMAKKKLEKFNDLKIVLITASYGKTSIKNFLFELLKDKFITHKTPRSVNTLLGLIKDINDNITEQTQIYIAEAGARLSGDIAQISQFLNPQIVVIGEIGKQHIEYFKTIENVRNTKLEALLSSRLEMAFLHSSTLKNESKNVVIYDKNLKEVVADLDGLSFMLNDDKFKTPLLGKFNATNLAACVLVAKYFGLSDTQIKNSLLTLKNVEHRLARMDAGGKVIIDDSFNGNLAGMSASYELVSSYAGRKVLITPGIVESTNKDNETLSKLIDAVFDVVIISSPLNAQSLLKYLNRPEIHILKDKNKMQEMLIKHTRVGDLILFSNDAPSFM